MATAFNGLEQVTHTHLCFGWHTQGWPHAAQGAEQLQQRLAAGASLQKPADVFGDWPNISPEASQERLVGPMGAAPACRLARFAGWQGSLTPGRRLWCARQPCGRACAPLTTVWLLRPPSPSTCPHLQQGVAVDIRSGTVGPSCAYAHLTLHRAGSMSIPPARHIHQGRLDMQKQAAPGREQRMGMQPPSHLSQPPGEHTQPPHMHGGQLAGRQGGLCSATWERRGWEALGEQLHAAICPQCKLQRDPPAGPAPVAASRQQQQLQAHHQPASHDPSHYGPRRSWTADDPGGPASPSRTQAGDTSRQAVSQVSLPPQASQRSGFEHWLSHPESSSTEWPCLVLAEVSVRLQLVRSRWLSCTWAGHTSPGMQGAPNRLWPA